MSTPNSNSTSTKRRLIQNSPFRQLTGRTDELIQVSLQDAFMVNLALIEANPNQPRKNIDPERLAELAADIKARGILQPPIVRRAGEKYQLIVGERRFRAAQLADLTEIPVLVKDLSDQEAQIVSLVENIQREDLSFGDEANYFKMMQQQYGFSIRDIAAFVNKSKSYVENRLNLLKNPELLAAVEAQKIGLHEANVLARMDKEAESESVREKDSTNIASESVREKDSYADFSPAIRQFIRQCSRLLEVTDNMAAKLQKAADDEREATLETVEALENELAKLKQRLRKHR